MSEPGADAVRLIGGRLALDFANTVDQHDERRPKERLTSYEELIAWSHHAGALSDGQAVRLLGAGASHAAESARVLERAIALREALYRVFSSAAHDRPAADGDLAVLNADLGDFLARSRLEPAAAGYGWSWAGGEADLDQMLWPIIHDALNLLTSPDLARVGECASHDCDWLFLDTSRNGHRRWCSMEDCGNRAKARRHYRREREAAAPAW